MDDSPHFLESLDFEMENKCAEPKQRGSNHRSDDVGQTIAARPITGVDPDSQQGR